MRIGKKRFKRLHLAYCEMAWSQPNCHEVLIWGLRDEDNWITLRNDGFFMGCQDAVIAEGDSYDKKAAYMGVENALNTLPESDDFGFSPLNEGDGSTAACGGIGVLEPALLSIQGPRAVNPGDIVELSIEYVAGMNQDLVVWFQLDENPFTVYSQQTIDLEEGESSVNIILEIPSDVSVATNAYRYLAFVTPDGADPGESLTQIIQNRVSVLGEGSQLIISSNGPEQVTPGETVRFNVSYSAVEDQEIVVWFQLDQSPFTTYQEFRQEALIGQNELEIELEIPSDVPIAQDAYQYQTLLVPTGGSWPDRISNFALTNIDVVIASSTGEETFDKTSLKVYPNPTDGSFFIRLPENIKNMNVQIFTSSGTLVQASQIPQGTEVFEIGNSLLLPGVYYLRFKKGNEITIRKIVKY
ncbi:T9SS type A sorting domain-containing protein [Portibacter marinus]|uniref:T9SS type A sorting domain-containing protein n=1 Tax=Portibacter marinus TaxID=2898660 RepID=UPI001F36BFAE|nr:T9SS type A sorting domain-containing protein [Portibacter marinus]